MLRDGRAPPGDGRPALLAQLVEHFHGKEGVNGSSPLEGSRFSASLSGIAGAAEQLKNLWGHTEGTAVGFFWASGPYRFSRPNDSGSTVRAADSLRPKL